MRKLIVIEFMTLDGVIQGPGGPGEDTEGGFSFGGWGFPYFDEFVGTIMQKQMGPPFDLLLGRKTYDIFASYWPQRGDEWPGVNEANKYVVTQKEFQPGWENTVILTTDVVGKIRQLKNEERPDLKVWGSSNLAQTLFAHDLVDELWLKIFPVTLGTGKRIFSEGTIPAAFNLTECKASPGGVIFANYQRAGAVTTGSF